MTAVRYKIVVSGVVQGVGFRPFIYQLAKTKALSGFVKNIGGTVEIEVEGAEAFVSSFVEDMRRLAPPLARIAQVDVLQLAPEAGLIAEPGTFAIVESERSSSGVRMISPDAATCADCVRELFDPCDRRYQYPFINCTNCGPRFTIIEELPYDRQSTTMREFPMCPKCRAEYEDPDNRRFHAQPNACFQCGPQVVLTDAAGNLLPAPEQAFAEAGARLLSGQILALKGLGGFHLACDATNDTAVQLLRARKHRPAKPFAVMFASIDQAMQYCHISGPERAALESPSSPICLLAMKTPDRSSSGRLSASLNLGLKTIGALLPYTPIHHLLMAEAKRPLVMTSGNISEEPICITNEDALAKLGSVADFFLLHNRGIVNRYDDSVVAQSATDASGPMVLRRARGQAPSALNSIKSSAPTVLAFGAQMKSAFAIMRDKNVYLSQHLGELESLECLANFQDQLTRYLDILTLVPDVIACDLHPNYLSTDEAEQFAARHSLPLYRVQHHHAHIAACMLENSYSEPVIGIAFDGTGYGGDGTIWGGEILVADFEKFERMASFLPVPMPGAAQAIKSPARMAFAYLHQFALSDHPCAQTWLERMEEQKGASLVRNWQAQIVGDVNSPQTTSAGRLFDAVSSLLNICHESLYEGQAACELEALAVGAASRSTGIPSACIPRHSRLSLAVVPTDSGDPLPYRIDQSSLLRQVLDAVCYGYTSNEIAFAFHEALADAVTTASLILKDKTGINTVCLSGGVFQNRLLLTLAKQKLQKEFTVLTHSVVPPNDGGIAVGQAVIAATKEMLTCV